jgi:hypothetical protein
VTISAAQKLALRKLFQVDQVGCKPGEEAAVAPEFILKVIELAESAGGEAPRPEKPNLTTVKEIKALTGNEQLAKLFEQHDVLTQNLTDWAKTAKTTQDRLPRWNSLDDLAGHAANLTEADEARQQMQTIEGERQFLADPDPVAPLCDKLGALRPCRWAHSRHRTFLSRKGSRTPSAGSPATRAKPARGSCCNAWAAGDVHFLDSWLCTAAASPHHKSLGTRERSLRSGSVQICGSERGRLTQASSWPLIC